MASITHLKKTDQRLTAEAGLASTQVVEQNHATGKNANVRIGGSPSDGIEWTNVMSTAENEGIGQRQAGKTD